jgi:hypothetical protein
MEIDLTWHSIDKECLGEAAGYWWRALKHGGLRHRLLRLTAKLCAHWALLMQRRMLTPISHRGGAEAQRTE